MGELKQRRENKANETFNKLRELGGAYADAVESAKNISFDIERQLEIAMTAGHSMAKLSEVSGLTEQQLEYILVAVGVQNRMAEETRRLNLRKTG